MKSFQQNSVSCAVYTTGSQVSSVFTAQAVSSNNNELHRCDIRVGRIFDYENDQRDYQVTVRATEDITGLSNEVEVDIYKYMLIKFRLIYDSFETIVNFGIFAHKRIFLNHFSIDRKHI